VGFGTTARRGLSSSGRFSGLVEVGAEDGSGSPLRPIRLGSGPLSPPIRSRPIGGAGSGRSGPRSGSGVGVRGGSGAEGRGTDIAPSKGSEGPTAGVSGPDAEASELTERVSGGLGVRRARRVPALPDLARVDRLAGLAGGGRDGRPGLVRWGEERPDGVFFARGFPLAAAASLRLERLPGRPFGRRRGVTGSPAEAVRERTARALATRAFEHCSPLPPLFGRGGPGAACYARFVTFMYKYASKLGVGGCRVDSTETLRPLPTTPRPRLRSGG
jgi:hypothetical protein